MRYWLFIMLVIVMSTRILAQDNIVTATISNATPFWGEAITYRVEFSSVRDLSNATIDLPEIIGFAQTQDFPTLSQTMEDGVLLNTLTQTVTLYANQTGNITLAPTRVIIPETPFDPGIEAESNSISISVQALPTDAPDSFFGAVGQFDIITTIDFTEVQAGSPNVLEVTIVGTGNIGQFTRPVPRLPENWVIFEQNAIHTSGSLQSITFPYQFFPTQTGQINIPATIFSYFDPIEASYRTLFSEEIMFSVAGKFSGNAIAPTLQPRNQIPLKQMTGESNNPIPTFTFWLLWLVIPIIALIQVVFVQLRTRFTSSKSVQNRSKLFNQVHDQLQQARQQSPNDLFRTVHQTIVHYLSTKYMKDIADVADMRQLTSDLPSQLQEQLLACLAQAESGKFAPVSVQDSKQLLMRTYKTIQQIEEL